MNLKKDTANSPIRYKDDDPEEMQFERVKVEKVKIA